MTVLEVIQRSAEFLAKRGVDSPRLQIELLLAHVLKLARMNLYLNFDRGLTDAELAIVRELVRRRGQREPLQHIVGSTSFCGLEIRVSPDALVPRPETELLAERAWQYLSTLPSSNVLDFGTGTGCLAIALALHCPGARVHAIDCSLEALTLARENAACHQLSDRIQFHTGKTLPTLPAGLSFDLIVSNPPYIASAELDTLPPEVRDHDPRAALDGGADGLDFFRLLASEGALHLEPDGRMMLEFGDCQEERIRELFVQHNWIVENVAADYSGRPRILTARPVRNKQ